MRSLVAAAPQAGSLPQAPKRWDPATPTADSGSRDRGWDGVPDAGTVMPLSAPWDSFALVQRMSSWGPSRGKNAGFSPLLPKPKARGKAATEGWPRGTAWSGQWRGALLWPGANPAWNGPVWV